MAWDLSRWSYPGSTDNQAESTVVVWERTSRCFVRIRSRSVSELSRLARIREKPIAQISSKVGVSDSCLWGWVAQADGDEGRRIDGLSTAERSELVELRCELGVT